MLIPKTKATVTAGAGATGIAVTPDRRSVYVVNSGDDTVSQYGVDPVTGSLTPKLPQTASTGRDPMFVAVTPDGNSAYVTNDFPARGESRDRVSSMRPALLSRDRGNRVRVIAERERTIRIVQCATRRT